jgi:hypothetical protein
MATWEVTKQRDSVKLISGDVVDVKLVTIVNSSTGETATLTVPMGAYNADYVKAQIQDYAAKHEGVSSLSVTT